MRILITGGCGFLGSNLARAALARGCHVTVLDNLMRTGSIENLMWLQQQGSIVHQCVDVRDAAAVASVVAATLPDAVFHVAGQVAMTTSLADPRMDFEINALGTFNVLEAVRAHVPKAVVIYSSTNKVYGGLTGIRLVEQATRWAAPEYPHGFDENTALDFHSPYGCSKGCADQYLLDWHRMFGLKTIVFRHSSMYGGRQFATFDQGWIGWFCSQIAVQRDQTAPDFTISGDGKQVRDVLHADDMINLYFAALDRADQAVGHAFNIGGGMQSSLSLIELFEELRVITGTTARYRRLPPRASDQLVFVADIAKAQRLLGWSPHVSIREGLKRMMEWVHSIPRT